jgi:hypothetical protein
MATTTSLTTTYAGEKAAGYLQAAFLSNDTINAITFKTGINYKQVVKRMTDNATAFSGQTCDFTPTGTVTIDERVLTLVPLALQRQLCKKDFLTDWEAESAQNGDLAGPSDALTETMMGLIGQINETMIWQGTAGTGAYAGFETLMLADSTVIDVATPEAITASNVVAKIQLLVADCPLRVRRAPERPKIYVASNVAEAYRNAQATLGNNNLYQSGQAISMTWLGQYDIVECPGMSDSAMVMAQASNLWFGTNLGENWTSIQVIDMQPVNGDKTVRFSADFYGSCQYGFGNEIALYHLDNA